MAREIEYDSTLIDNEVALEDAIHQLNQYKRTSNSLIAVDCEGVSLSRNGELTILAIATRDKAYIFDVFEIGAAIFNKRIREILEDSANEKLMFDCRQDSDALWHQFRVKLAGVLDLQLLEVMHRRANPTSLTAITSQSNNVERINGYRRCLELYLDDRRLVRAKDTGAQLLKLNSQIWKQRPLPKTLIQYCAVDTMGMFNLYDKMKHIISSSVEKSRLETASEMYVNYYRKKDRRTNDSFERNPFLPLGIIPERGTASFPLADTTCTACRRQFPRREFSANELRQRVQTCRVCREVKRQDAMHNNRRRLQARPWF